MNSGTRACIAYIAGRIISSKDSAGVFDLSVSIHFGFSGRVTANLISLHDHERNCAVVGKADDSRLYIHDFGSDSELSLKIKDKQFSGCDYGTSKNFNGSVSGNKISIYDYENATMFNYSYTADGKARAHLPSAPDIRL